MDNRINQIRKQIRALRVSMLEAEAIMREQINRDEECSFVAGEVLKMRAIMSLSDRVVALNLGRNLAEGSPREIANHPAVIEAYLGDPKLMTMSETAPS